MTKNNKMKDVKTQDLAILSDAKEGKKVEEARRRSEEKYRGIVENMEDGYAEYDLKGNISFVNNSFCRQTGYTREEIIGMNYRRMHRPEVAQSGRRLFEQIYKTGEPAFLVNHEVLRKDGSTMIVQSNSMLMCDEAGRPTGFSTMARDITKIKEAEETIRHNEERYRTILEATGEGYIELDIQGRWLFFNEPICRFLGYTHEELACRNFRKLHPPESLQRLIDFYARILETGEPGLLFDVENIAKDGSILITQINATLMRNETGEPIGFRVLARDITERKKAEAERAKIEQQLIQAQKMESVGRLAGGVAHDFNNMITVILGYTELIKLRLPQDSPLLSDITEIEKAAVRSRDITGQLLAFSRKAMIAPKIVDMNEIITSTQKAILRLIGEDIDLRFYPGNNLWKIKFDRSQMENILINLAVNARDAMPEGGRLTIETENVSLSEAYSKTHDGFTAGSFVALGVSDEGIGMDKETLLHIFEPFFTTKETGKGSGLGLAMVYGIVKQSGGFINVYSEPGKGATFKVYIPSSEEEAEVSCEETGISAEGGTVTILLVEDDEMVRTLAKEMLEAIGYVILDAASPEEALSLFKNHHLSIDMVMTDVVMPKMSGKQMIEQIVAIRPGIPVLYMSGYTANVIAHRGVLDEGVCFIQKPFSMNDLAVKVRTAMTGK